MQVKSVGMAVCNEIKLNGFNLNTGWAWTDVKIRQEIFNKFDPNNIEKVIFNPPATIVIFKDGSKEVVKCGDGDSFLGKFNSKEGLIRLLNHEGFDLEGCKDFINGIYKYKEE